MIGLGVLDLTIIGFMSLGLLFSLFAIIVSKRIEEAIASLDVLNIIISALILLLGVVYKNSLFYDIAMIYAVIGFMETIVFSRILETTKKEEE